MYLNAHIQVFINGQQLESVSSVDIKNDAHQIGASCEIVLPLNARFGYDATKGFLIQPTRTLFNTGDYILIKAKYDGYESFGDSTGWVQIFEGFIYDFYETTPVKIKCLDYIYWLNMGMYGTDYVFTKKLSKSLKVIKGSVKSGTGKSFKSIEFSDLLQDIVDWTNSNIEGYNDENGTSFPTLTLIKPQFSFQLVNITFSNMSCAAVLEYLKRELGFNISLIGTQLYANVASFTTNVVNLSTDTNVIESNLQSTNLTKHRTKASKGANSVFTRIKLKAYFEKEDGTKDSFELGDPNGQSREVYFYKVAKGNLVSIGGQNVYDNYYKLANEALNKCYQVTYTGMIETYLYPVFDIFWKVNYNDVRYPERNGAYSVTSMDIKIDDRGFHRHSKLAFLTDINVATVSNG